MKLDNMKWVILFIYLIRRIINGKGGKWRSNKHVNSAQANNGGIESWEGSVQSM